MLMLLRELADQKGRLGALTRAQATVRARRRSQRPGEVPTEGLRDFSCQSGLAWACLPEIAELGHKIDSMADFFDLCVWAFVRAVHEWRLACGDLLVPCSGSDNISP